MYIHAYICTHISHTCIHIIILPHIVFLFSSAFGIFIPSKSPYSAFMPFIFKSGFHFQEKIIYFFFFKLIDLHLNSNIFSHSILFFMPYIHFQTASRFYIWHSYSANICLVLPFKFPFLPSNQILMESRSSISLLPTTISFSSGSL